MITWFNFLSELYHLEYTKKYRCLRYWDLLTKLLTYIYVIIFLQEWSFDLQERSNRMLQCDRLNALSRSPDISINIGSSLRRNYSHIIRSWFIEIRTFLPKFKTCLNLNDCKRFLTVGNLFYYIVSSLCNTCV